MLHADQLKKAMFPVGHMTKAQVRAIAEQHGLINSKKKDSTGVCFIGERRFKKFLQEFLPAQPGDMVAPDGKVVGRHDGLMYYTLGQRRGLGIGGMGDGRSWFVIGKDLQRNRLLVAQGEDHPMLYSTLSLAVGVTWVGDAPIGVGETLQCTCKYRYRQVDTPVELVLFFNGLPFGKDFRVLLPITTILLIVFSRKYFISSGSSNKSPFFFPIPHFLSTTTISLILQPLFYPLIRYTYNRQT